MIENVKHLARQAGEIIWEIYEKNEYVVETKSDNTPVTTADLRAHVHIVEGLAKFSDFPILSEEDVIPYEERKNWSTYWLIDPLDGTKGFINHTGDFTVNIALIERGHPILGVIYVPETKDLYSAEKNQGAFKNGQLIKNTRTGPFQIGLASRLHKGQEQQYFESLGIAEIIRVSSSLKLCWLAEGKADVYYRPQPTMEWDTGAGEIILTEANCDIINAETLESLSHNTTKLENPAFVAFRKTEGFLITT